VKQIRIEFLNEDGNRVSLYMPSHAEPLSNEEEAWTALAEFAILHKPQAVADALQRVADRVWAQTDMTESDLVRQWNEASS
jgi:hypothetical protein